MRIGCADRLEGKVPPALVRAAVCPWERDKRTWMLLGNAAERLVLLHGVVHAVPRYGNLVPRCRHRVSG